MASSAAIQSAVIQQIIPQTPDTQTLRVGLSVDFKPGQAVAVVFPGDPKKRFYSISSSPTETGHLDITVKAERGTPLFAQLFSLEPGTKIEVSAPMGSFLLPEKIEGSYCFLAGGTGVTPFRSMIKYLLDKKMASGCWLFHSVRTPDDLLFKDDFLSWSEAGGFSFVPTFTRSTDATPGGESGRIGEALLRKHYPLPQGTFYICGPTAFVNAMEHVLTNKLAVSTAQIHREQWASQ